MKRAIALCICLILCVGGVLKVFAEAESSALHEKVQVYEDEIQMEEDTGQQEEELEAGNAEEVLSDESKGDMNLTSKALLLMEASTGQIVFEQNSNEQLRPASITKIMTLLLIFDALDSGVIKLEDEVSVSEYAASMGGSQVFFEPGEIQSVDTMIKCISVASANDACVAMAEHIYGSEEEFVAKMNERAAGLGMNATTFKNCNGLDIDGHITSANDVALMSRELITKYPQVHNYSTIWMDTITHVTAKGSSDFGLANTNKLLKQYEWCNGLKTGSTSLAKYCVSATAEKDGVKMIAVIMAAPDFKVRFQEAAKLLNYGFAKCRVYDDLNQDILPRVKVEDGITDESGVVYSGEFHYLDVNGLDLSQVKKEIKMETEVKAPVKKGQKAGEAVYSVNGQEIGKVEIQYTEDVEKAAYPDCLMKIFHMFLLS